MNEVPAAATIGRRSAAAPVASGAVAPPSHIRPLETTWQVVGRAFAVEHAGGHDLRLHNADRATCGRFGEPMRQGGGER